MIILDKEIQERVISFKKYAEFISDKFGIEVVFDGINAHTDGKVITLPNLAGMSKNEVEFLYCILLHEAGHIRYSTFTTEAFKKIKTNNHFLIANAIEDARIENLLIKDFDGANDIFEDLYNKFASDKKFWKKIFGFTVDEATEFSSIINYIHYSILNIKNKISLESITGKRNHKKVINFIASNSLDKIIESHPLNDWDDVISLSNKVYDLYFTGRKDKSRKVDIEKSENTISEVKTEISAFSEASRLTTEEIKSLQSQVKGLREEIEALWRQNGPEIEKLERNQEVIINEIDTLSNVLESRDQLSNDSQKLEKALDRISKKKSDLSATENKIKSYETKTALSEKDEARLSRLKDKASKIKESISKYDERIKRKKDDTKELEAELDKVSEEIKNSSTEEIQQKINKLSEEETSIFKKLSELEGAISEKTTESSNLQTRIKKLKEQQIKDSSKQLKEIRDMLRDSGISVESLPGFEKTPGWEEADSVQMQFDEDASIKSGSLVVNGSSFLKSNQRDLLSIIEKVSTELKEIDLAKHFKETHGVNKLDNLNNLANIKNSGLLDSKIYSSERKHIPLTTQLDVVKQNTSSSGSDLLKIKMENSSTINEIKNLFKHKLKFNKKDKFKGNQEEGFLDQRSLWKLATLTDDNFYEISTPKFVNSVTASIAIDISGSMDGDSTKSGKKLKELSLFISEALKECHVRHEICGYHAPISHEMRAIQKSSSYNRTSNILETVIYRGFNDKLNSGIQNIEIQCSDNSDGESLKLIGHRLLKERGRRKILFIISDGKPYLSDSDLGVLDQDLKNTILWLKQNKIDVFSFGFNEQGRLFYGDQFCYIKSYEDVLNFLKKSL